MSALPFTSPCLGPLCQIPAGALPPVHESDVIPFTLHSGKYEVSAGLKKFDQAAFGQDAERGHFFLHSLADHAAVVAAKLTVLEQYLDICSVISEDATKNTQNFADGVVEICRFAFITLAEEQPQLAAFLYTGDVPHALYLPPLGIAVDIDTGTYHIHAETTLTARADTYLQRFAQSPTWMRLWHVLSLAVSEDIVILRGPVGEMPDVLELLHVCFPSAWAPRQKVGLHFSDVHRPVAHSENLLRTHKQLVKAMTQGGPFIRYTWGIYPDAQLCCNPEIYRPTYPLPTSKDDALAHAFLRAERQSLASFPEQGRALFTIRTFLQAASRVAQDAYRREKLISALESMDEESMQYKNLMGRRDLLVEGLRSLSS